MFAFGWIVVKNQGLQMLEEEGGMQIQEEVSVADPACSRAIVLPKHGDKSKPIFCKPVSD